MAVKIQIRRGTASEWASANPILMEGEAGTETDTYKMKIGNGTDNWNDLPYTGSGENNTASNLGTGEGVFSQKDGIDLKFKSLKAGDNVTINSTSEEITISSTGGGAGSGDVTGPESSINNNLVAFDGTTGKIIKDSGIPLANIDQDVSQDATPTFKGIKFTPLSVNPAYQEGHLYYNEDSQAYGFYVKNQEIPIQEIGRDLNSMVTNETGFDIPKGSIVSSDGISSTTGKVKITLSDFTDLTSSKAVLGITTEQILNGSNGLIQIQGFITNIDTSTFSEGDLLFGDYRNPGAITNISPNAPNYSVRVGQVLVVGSADGVIGVQTLAFNGSDTDVNIQGSLNGICTQLQAVEFSVSGGIIYADVYNERLPTENLPVIFGGKRYELDTTTNVGPDGKARVALTSGTVDNPQFNIIYIDYNSGNPILGASTIFPTGNVSIIGVVGVKDAVTTLNDGVLGWQRYNNSIDNGDSDGFNQWLSLRVRLMGSVWFSGISPTITIDDAQTPDSVNITLSSGITYQMHLQTFNATDGTEYYIVNHPTDGIKKINDLNEIDVDASGNLITNDDIIGLNIFASNSSSGGVDRVLITLPNDRYYRIGTNTGIEDALNDSKNYAVTSIPQFTGLNQISVRICRLVLQYSTDNGGEWTNIVSQETGEDYQDERGLPQGSSSGSGSGQSLVSSFSDSDFSVYNSSDATKIIRMDASQIGTGIQRTITMPDKNVTLLNYDDVLTRTNTDIYTPTGDYNPATKKYVDETTGGDMIKAVYDPNLIESDAFDMDNMVEGVISKILTVDERNKIADSFQKSTDNMDDIIDGTTYVKTTNDYTDIEKSKLSSIEEGAQVNTVDSVNGYTGNVFLDADDISDSTTNNKFITQEKLDLIDTNASDISDINDRLKGMVVVESLTEFKTAVEDTTKTDKYIYCYGNWNNELGTTINASGINHIYGECSVNNITGGAITINIVGPSTLYIYNLFHWTDVTLNITNYANVYVNRYIEETTTITRDENSGFTYQWVSGTEPTGVEIQDNWFVDVTVPEVEQNLKTASTWDELKEVLEESGTNKYIIITASNETIPITASDSINVIGNNTILGNLFFSPDSTTYTLTFNGVGTEFMFVNKTFGIFDNLTINSSLGGVAVNFLNVLTGKTLTIGSGSITYQTDKSLGTVTGTTTQSNWFSEPTINMDNVVDGTTYVKTENNYSDSEKNKFDNLTKLSDDRLRVTSDNGYVEIAPSGASYTNYITDRSSGHLFDKNVRVTGTIYAGSSYNQRVWDNSNSVVSLYSGDSQNPTISESKDNFKYILIMGRPGTTSGRFVSVMLRTSDLTVNGNYFVFNDEVDWYRGRFTSTTNIARTSGNGSINKIYGIGRV